MTYKEAEFTQSTDSRVVRDRAIRLFKFLRELYEIRMKTIRTLDQYDEVIWFSDIPQLRGCHCIAWPHGMSGTSDWVEITKPTLLSPPTVPDLLLPWLDERDVRDSSGDMPELAKHIAVEEESEPDEDGKTSIRTIIRNLEDCPDVQQAWESYMENEWLPWAEHDKPLQQVQKIYTRLYSLYQQQQRLGEAYEVLLGLGYLTWHTPSSQVVKRHIVTAQVAVSFDAARGKVSVGSAAEGAKPELEQDMLEAEERPDANELRGIEDEFREMGDAVWETEHIHTILASWLNTITGSQKYDPSIDRQQDVQSAAQIHFAPAIILRKRTERSLLRAFKEICGQLENETTPVPQGIVDIVRDPDTSRPAFDDHPIDTMGTNLADDEVYFPLPANDKQTEIAHRIRSHRGVLVQGPPGTGKSHTIANLVCHLLASGKRVLVTSHTPRALTVLQDKFPEEIAPLCVMALGDDSRSMKRLEASVQGILARDTNWDAVANDREIARSKAGVHQARQDEAQTLLYLRAIRESETYHHSALFGGYDGTLRTIAQRIRAEETQYNWLSDIPEEDAEPPMTDDEAVELLSLMRDLNYEKVIDTSFPIINIDDLEEPSSFSEFVEAEREAQQQYDRVSAIRKRPEYAALASCDQAKRNTLISAFQVLVSAYETLANNINPWVNDVALRVLAGQEHSMVELNAVTEGHLKSVGENARAVSERTVSGLGDRDRQLVRTQANALLEHLESGGKLRHWTYVARPRVVKDALYLVEEVCVNGRKCAEAEPLRELLEWIDFLDRLEALDAHWSSLLPPPAGSIIVRKAEYESYNLQLKQCLELRTHLKEARSAVSRIPGLCEPIWYQPARIAEYVESAEAVSLECRLDEAGKNLDAIYNQITDILKTQYHELIAGLAVAIKKRDQAAYSESYQRLSASLEKHRKFIRMETLLHKLADAAPSCHEELVNFYTYEVWHERMASFGRAWDWSRANRWLCRMSDPTEQKRLQSKLKHVRTEAQKHMASLAAAKAWRHCKTRLSESARQHLQSWQLAISAYGKGTGVHANRHRQDARMHLEECRSAIPAWIMPIYRVAETVEMSPDIFDVVIVDEASQSGPEALFLQFLAKTVVVVGDDKQIKPQFVGMDSSAVNLLRQRLITDLPHSDRLGIDHSFFDQARIRYSSPICLREHFRCMPEIIQFCNDLCYQTTPLIPLKQYGAGRLSPTIQTVHVTNGYQKGRSPKTSNPPEAESLVEYITQCCADPAYEGKTMGVISLLGEEQAKLLQSLLLQTVGPEEMEKHQIHCGDAYAFQGDERDVIFLSMVSSPTGDGHHIGTLASDDAEKRFNVAVSRAKDQLWLFHSATLNDLSLKCLRYRLLDYCQNSAIKQTEIAGAELNIEQLRAYAATASRNDERPPSPFDSWFEVDVFLLVHGQGYRAIPQYPVAGYRIDLVIEGMRGRLAVECDGDTWHGPEQYEQDMARQRQLERSGFPFWRVRASVFYRDPKNAMESLWEALHLHSIFSSSSETTHEKSEKLDRPLQQAQESDKADQNIATILPTEEPHNTDENATRQLVAPKAATPKTRIGHMDEGQQLALTIQQNKNGVAELISGETPLTPYRHWVSRTLPDPKSAKLSEIVKGLVEIVESEGPMLSYRAYSLYAHSAGIQRIRKETTRPIFDKAMRKAIASGKIIEDNDFVIDTEMGIIVRVPDSPKVIVRTRGDRTIEEIPPSEIAQFMQELIKQDDSPEDTDRETLYRSVLSMYGLVRMTDNTRAILDHAFELARIRV